MLSDRKSLLELYKKTLRSAKTFPSVNREGIYQSIREEWRMNKNLPEGEKRQRQLAVAYKGLEQLRQFDVSTMTKGKIHSHEWQVQLEENPFPKPPDYDERKRQERGGR